MELNQRKPNNLISQQRHARSFCKYEAKGGCKNINCLFWHRRLVHLKNTSERTDDMATPLLDVLEQDELKFEDIELVLQRHPSVVRHVEREGLCPLYITMPRVGCSVAIIKLLLSFGADPNYCGRGRCPAPLFGAMFCKNDTFGAMFCKYDTFGIVKALIEGDKFHSEEQKKLEEVFNKPDFFTIGWKENVPPRSQEATKYKKRRKENVPQGTKYKKNSS